MSAKLKRMHSLDPGQPALRALLLIVWAVAACPSAGAFAAEPRQEQSQSPQPAGAAPKCLEAIVSPVSGFAECVNPRGAAVDQPRRADVPCGIGASHCDGKSEDDSKASDRSNNSKEKS